LWVVFPGWDSVTTFWRQGSGEQYKYQWHAFWRSLSKELKELYRAKYPEPPEKELCWAGFYDEIAEKPAGKEHPLADMIVGRV
jgi:hypothetical protein